MKIRPDSIAQRLHGREAVRADAERLAGIEQRAPEALRVVGLRVDLESELARIARPRDQASGHPSIVTSSRKRK